MTQSNINNKKATGFTIVELLVVIVVIGILAAITIVSYTGISAKANTASNKSNASSVITSAQTYYAENNAFPTTLTVAAFNTNNAAKLPAGLVMVATTLAASTSLQYLVNAGGGGVCVGYWDYSTSSAKYLYTGDATTGTNAAIPTCV